ncbi:hypothetical protein SCAR479_07180 [Seiridium cardinale]|uniref:F-box domain-containing protein n=1 Tax=Seiridium cardinale TaxID=138064 RepID=A0ABR2XRF7_9PEZI
MPRATGKASGPDKVLRSTRSSGVQKSSPPLAPSERRTRSARVEGQYSEVKAKPRPATSAKPKANLPSYTSYLHRPQQEVSSDPNQRTRLFAVPVEITREVASHLSPAHAVCLTLTCKLALQTLGTSSWNHESVRQRWHLDPLTNICQRTALLELLVHDLQHQDMVYCERCNSIHGPLKKPSDHRETKLTKYCWGQDAAIDYPRSELGGYSLVFDHIRQVFETTAPNSSLEVEYLCGAYEIPHPNFHYTISTSGRRLNGNLVVQHEYVFQSQSSKTPLKPTDVLNLPLRVCPHQSTTVVAPTEARYAKNKLNSPLFTYSITCAFPVAQRTSVPPRKNFRNPTPLEEQMLVAIDTEENPILRCRYCPTKWKVEYADGSASRALGAHELKVTVWHCFYNELYRAAKVWPWFVRRGALNLGKSKMNTEFWSQTRSFVDFEVE